MKKFLSFLLFGFAMLALGSVGLASPFEKDASKDVFTCSIDQVTSVDAIFVANDSVEAELFVEYRSGSEIVTYNYFSITANVGILTSLVKWPALKYTHKIGTHRQSNQLKDPAITTYKVPFISSYLCARHQRLC